MGNIIDFGAEKEEKLVQNTINRDLKRDSAKLLQQLIDYLEKYYKSGNSCLTYRDIVYVLEDLIVETEKQFQVVMNAIKRGVQNDKK